MFEIPDDRLPPGFLETVIDPPARPAQPRPASTIVLLREGGAAMEVLLMRRHRSSGFVPGAWVFPGGRVDPGDSGPALYERLDGVPRALAQDGGAAISPDPAFLVASLRELFEETGILLARSEEGEWAPDAAADRRVETLRRRLMDGTGTILDVLEELDLRLDARGVVHIAHWVTPVVEPRRYDTHFYAVEIPPGRSVRPDPREMTDVTWASPAEALARFERGELPMVFPTVRTLQMLAAFESVEQALGALRHRRVPRILPRLVRTEGGVAIVVDE